MYKDSEPCKEDLVWLKFGIVRSEVSLRSRPSQNDDPCTIGPTKGILNRDVTLPDSCVSSNTQCKMCEQGAERKEYRTA